MSIFFIVLYFSGILSFRLKCKHLLVMLLSLEMVILSLFIFLFAEIISVGFSSYFCMIFLSISVCESSLGLSILVSIIRSHGRDYFRIFNVLW